MRSILIVLLMVLYNLSFAQKNSDRGVLVANELLSIALNSPEIKEYYHFDKSGRENLVIVNRNWLHQPLDTILIFNKQVQVVNALNSSETNFIQIVSIKQEGDKIELNFKYKIEGILIKAELVKVNEIWQRKNIYIVEN